MSFNDILIRLQSQEKRRDTDSKHTDQRDLRRFQRIGEHKYQRDQAQQEGKYILHEEQACRALDIIDHSSPFQHDLGHTGEIRLQKHELGRLGCRLASRSHGDTAVRIFERQHIVDTVPGHCHRMSGILEDAHEFSLLVRSNTPEHCVFQYSLPQFFLCLQLRGIHISVCVFYPGLLRYI